MQQASLNFEAAREAGLISFDELKSNFHYDPETGVFTRLHATGNRGRHRAGEVIGWVSHGYKAATINHRTYLIHRLAFLYMTGRFPMADIDHINGDGKDNRWVNLRAVPHQVNMQNQRLPKKTNKAGLLGVYLRKSGKYEGAVRTGEKRISKGFDTKEEAYGFYLETKRKVHDGCTL